MISTHFTFSCALGVTVTVCATRKLNADPMKIRPKINRMVDIISGERQRCTAWPEKQQSMKTETNTENGRSATLALAPGSASSSGEVIISIRSENGYRVWEKVKLSDLSYDLVSLDDLKRLGVDKIHVLTVGGKNPF
jgi:hypothetical protein